MQAFTLGHGLLKKAQGDEKRRTGAEQRINELKARLTQMSKLKDIERANELLQERLAILQTHFEASESEMKKEMASLRDFAEHAENRAVEAEVARQTLEIDLATKRSECDLKGKVLE